MNGFGTYRPAAISRSIPGDIPDPLVFAVMQHHPRNLAHLVQTGAGVNHKHRKMKEECAEKRTGQRDSPHADRQTVHIEQRIPAGGEDPVDHHRADAAPDHVDRENHEHADQIVMRLFRQFETTGNQRNRT